MTNENQIAELAKKIGIQLTNQQIQGIQSSIEAYEAAFKYETREDKEKVIENRIRKSNSLS